MKAPDTRTIILDNPEDVDEAIQGVYDAITESLQEVNFQEAFETKVFPAIETAERGYFASETDSSGQAWAPLAASTIAKKGHDIILVETGALRASLVGVTGDSIRDAGADFGVFGTSDPKAMFHQEGTSRMPARPPVGVSEELLETIAGIIGDAVIAQISGS